MKTRAMHRPTEVKAVVKLLTEAPEGATAEDLAESILLTVDEMRVDRTSYGVAVQGLPCAYIYQSFSTAKEAEKWVHGIGLDWQGLSVGVIPLYSRNRPLARHQRIKEEAVKLNEPGEPTPGSRRRFSR